MGNKLQQFPHDSVLLVRAQRREHGQRQNSFSHSLGDGEVAFPEPEVCVGFLKMQWHGVMNSSADSCLGELFAQTFAVVHLHYIKVINRLARGWLMRNGYGFVVSEKSVISSGRLPTLLIPARQMGELDAQNSCLDSIEPSVVALDVVVVLLGLTMIAKHADLAGKLFVISRDCARFSACAQIFPGI